MMQQQASQTGMIQQVMLCKQPSGGPDIKVHQELPVSGRSCLSLCVPILQGTENDVQSSQSSFIMDELDLLWYGRQLALSSSASISGHPGLQPKLVSTAADQRLL